MCPCGNVALHNRADSEDTQIHAPTIRHLSINPRPALGTATRRGHREGERGYQRQDLYYAEYIIKCK